MYHEKVTSPISLNDIKNCLESNSYSNIIDVVNDLKRVFSNAMSYYSVSSIKSQIAYYISYFIFGNNIVF